MKNFKKLSIKCIIPDLVSLETDLRIIKGSYLFQDLDFFPVSKGRVHFYYKIVIAKVDIPNNVDFQSGYYTMYDNCWFYKRTFLGLVLYMKYDMTSKTFYINQTYLRIPFEIGGIYPLGKHISDVIALDLTLAGYTVIRGCSYRRDGKIETILRPSFNGKTTKVSDELKLGADYIAEDVLVIDTDNEYVYPTMAFRNNFSRGINKEVYRLAKSQQLIHKQKISTLNVLTYSKGSSNITKEEYLSNYLQLNGLLYADNRFIKAYIFANHLVDRLRNAETKFINNKLPLVVERIESREKLNAKHWNELGDNYNDAWTGFAKQRMSEKELKLITSNITSSKKILDIGFGTGRIIQALSEKFPSAEIFGVDVALKMVKHCEHRFAGNPQIKRLIVGNAYDVDKLFNEKFDAITAVRVLKYNSNWPEIVEKLTCCLKPGGVLIYSMTNKNSLNRYGKYHIAYERTTPGYIKRMTKHLDLDVLKIHTFTRLPDKIYSTSTNPFFQKFIIIIESCFSILRNGMFGREIFIITRKSTQ
jgi:ubiquinone/menaquinone biosynthesis C-methylase UbiE